MEIKEKPVQRWVGFPASTEEQIEDEVVSLITTVLKWKKWYDHPGACWRVGTTNAEKVRLQSLPAEYVSFAVSSWHKGSPLRAAQEIVEFHGMELDAPVNEKDTHIYAYTNRSPTTLERKARDKEPLTTKQKRVYRAIRTYYEKNDQGPSRTEVMKLMGHRSITTTNGFLDILQRKNWIIIPDGRRTIELM